MRLRPDSTSLLCQCEKYNYTHAAGQPHLVRLLFTVVNLTPRRGWWPFHSLGAPQNLRVAGKRPRFAFALNNALLLRIVLTFFVLSTPHCPSLTFIITPLFVGCARIVRESYTCASRRLPVSTFFGHTTCCLYIPLSRRWTINHTTDAVSLDETKS